MLVEGLKDLRVGQNGKTWCYISMIIVISFLSESLNAVGFCHYVFVKIEEYIYFLVHYNLFVCCIGHLCSLVPRPCTFVACSTCRGTNFVLQATNAQGLGTRLPLMSLITNHNMLVYEEVGTVEFLIHCNLYKITSILAVRID